MMSKLTTVAMTLLLAMPAYSVAPNDTPPPLLQILDDETTAVEDLDALLALALARNRDLRAARFRVEAAEARIRPAGSLEDPALGLGYQEGMGLKDFPSYGDDAMSQIMISIEQMIPGPGKRALRREIASALRRRASAEAEVIRLEVGVSVKRRHWTLYRVDREAAILERTRENLRALAAAAQARYAAGGANQEDVFRAGLEIAAISARLRTLEEERRVAVAELNALLDREPDHAIGRGRGAAVHATPPALALAAAALEANPVIAALRHLVASEDAALRLARAERFPDLGLMAEVMPRGGFATMWTVGVKVPLPLRAGERQAEWEREARANRAAATEELEAARRNLRTRIDNLVAAAESARDLVTLHDESIIPQAGFALQASITGYRVGRSDFMTVLANVTALREYEVERTRRLADFHVAVAELEALIGAPLAGKEKNQ